MLTITPRTDFDVTFESVNDLEGREQIRAILWYRFKDRLHSPRFNVMGSNRAEALISLRSSVEGSTFLSDRIRAAMLATIATYEGEVKS